MTYRIYSFSDGGDASERTSGDKRWSLAHNYDNEYTWRFCEAIPLADDEVVVKLSVDNDGPPEDVPWVDGRLLVVSSRLRVLLEQHAPGHIQFLRTEIAGLEAGVPPYWVANLTYMCDCMSREKSTWEVKKYGRSPEEILVTSLVVDAGLVPEKLLLGRVRHIPTYIVIKNELKSILEEAGITGAQYYELDTC